MTGGAYKLKTFNPSGNWNASWHPNCNQRLTVTMTMKRVDNQNTIFKWNSGMILKADVDEDNKTVTGYSFAYNNAELTTSGGEGQAVIWRLDGFKRTLSIGNARAAQRLPGG